ncbi:condensation domain-containing protein [Clostridium bowmanii]|uniref:condensation domain-containing protein n=1 Tax=Clostridium bowmanii TaxID=132925 RepID=UPI001C0C6052|nr:condensation domain-containing protein [Clostridium bowmanii]MBU3188243.1 AMP-binding protein [Clostridium bowmanii]MCA1072629.1 condensation domain-containing protein [Clostridium bowmanii]
MDYKTITEAILSLDKCNDKSITFIVENNEIKVKYPEILGEGKKVLHMIQSKGLVNGDPLIFQFDDNKQFIVTFIACILGGIIPVPIDRIQNKFNIERIKGIVKKMPNSWIITSECALDSAMQIIKDAEDILLIEKFEKQSIRYESYSEYSESEKIFNSKEDDICYMQFSSGSTSQPKGVMITHKAMISNISDVYKGFELTQESILFNWTPLTHNLALIIFGVLPLVYQVEAYLMQTSMFLQNPIRWLQEIDKRKITCSGSPNFAFKYVLQTIEKIGLPKLDLSSLKVLFTGGEQISFDTCESFVKILEPLHLSYNSIIAAYGMSEATVGVSISPINKHISAGYYKRESLIVGKKVELGDEKSNNICLVDVGYILDGIQIRICDNDKIVIEEGVAGKIQLKGDALTAGYYELEHATKNLYTGDNWLKTGDIGFLNKGRLTIIGREKDLIIVNGVNIYCHDIEKYVADSGECMDSQVVAVSVFDSITKEDRTVIFIENDLKFEQFEIMSLKIKAFIGSNYGLIINEILQVESIPKTTSGKKQRFKLAQAYEKGEFNQIKQRINAIDNNHNFLNSPKTLTEVKIFNMWCDVLKNEKCGIDDNFFLLGGNSIKVIAMVGLIKERLNKVVAASAIFKHPTIKSLSAILDKINSENINTLKNSPSSEYYPLSKEQLGIYISSCLTENNTMYNIPVAARIYNCLIDPIKAEDIINRLVQKYEILRTSIELVNLTPMQKVHENVLKNVEYRKISEEDLEHVIETFVIPFKFTESSLMRLEINEVENDTIILIDMHHIISDGTSISLFLSEFLNTYFGKELQPSKFQFKDYVHYQNSSEYNLKIQDMNKYWMEQFSTEVFPIYLPEDFDRLEVKKYNGNRIGFQLDKEIITNILNISNDHNVTNFMTFLSVYNIFINLYTGDNDIVIGTPAAGRQMNEIQDMLGVFINMVPIRTNFNDDIKFSELLKIVSNNVINALDNGEYPFDMLINKLGIKRDSSITPLFNIAFVYQNFTFPKIEGLKYSLKDVNTYTSQYDLLLTIYAFNDGLKFEFEYDTNLFKDGTIVQFINSFCDVIDQITQNPEININDIEIYGKQSSKVIIDKLK